MGPPVIAQMDNGTGSPSYVVYSGIGVLRLSLDAHVILSPRALLRMVTSRLSVESVPFGRSMGYSDGLQRPTRRLISII